MAFTERLEALTDFIEGRVGIHSLGNAAQNVFASNLKGFRASHLAG